MEINFQSSFGTNNLRYNDFMVVCPTNYLHYEGGPDINIPIKIYRRNSIIKKTPTAIVPCAPSLSRPR